jgi:HlyD family secretion protein
MLAPTVDAQNRTGMVYVDLPASAQGLLKPGMFVRGEFEFGSLKALMVPQQSVVVRDGFSKSVCGASRPAGQIYKVSVGRRQGDMLEITSGLANGCQCGGAGCRFFDSVGDLVKVVP